MEALLAPAFWIAVAQIILIDILLGGDNAVVIALACRGLPPQQRKLGVIYGTAGAIVLRVILIAFALALLSIPYLKAVGGALLVWIGVQLLMPQDHPDDHSNIQSTDKLWKAVKTVIVADLVMSVDNVLAIAGAAHGAGSHQLALVIFGLVVSIPIIVAGSQLVLKLMDRFPVVITLGAMLLGWIAGQMAFTDPGVRPHLPAGAAWEYVAAAAGALLVLLIGKLLARRRGEDGTGE